MDFILTYEIHKSRKCKFFVNIIPPFVFSINFTCTHKKYMLLYIQAILTRKILLNDTAD